MALPTSAIRSGKRGTTILTISAQTASFDLPFDMFPLFSLVIQLTGTIGTAATALQVSCDNTNFSTCFFDPVGGGAATGTLVVGAFSMHRNDLAYPFFNLHHVAGGGSSLAFIIAASHLRG